MRYQLFKIAILSIALGTLASGCTTENGSYTKIYCDDSGCNRCDGFGKCWPLPNQDCTSDKQCKSNEKCSNIGCTPTCQNNTVCPAGSFCGKGLCGPGNFEVKPYSPPASCKGAPDCKTGEFCDAGKCKAKCKSDDDCSPGNVCTACGKCQPKGVPATCGTTPTFCSATISCNAGKTCSNNRCLFECSTSNTCPTGQVCAAGLCKDDPSPTNPECTLDMDCADGACINGYCHVSCATSGECGSVELCLMGICQPNYHPAK